MRRAALALASLLLGAQPVLATSVTVPDSNLLALGTGALLVSAPPTYSGWDAFWLLDETPDTGWAQQQEGDKGPFSFVFEMAGKSEISALGFSTAQVDTEGADARDVRVELADSAKGPWQPLWAGTLKSRRDGQRLPVAAKAGRYVRLTILNNHGSEKWTELMDVAAYGKPLAPFAVPKATGQFESTFGIFRIAQNGVAAEGCYDNDFGLIENGGFEGRVLRFSWSEKNNDGSLRGRGPAIFIFNDDGSHFTGYYWQESNSQGRAAGLWNGDRVHTVPGSCPHWKPTPKDGAGTALAKQLKTEGRVRLYGILFDTDSDVIKPESKATLEALIAAAKSDAAMPLLIEGHTDNTGGTAHNATLSARRAASVKAALVAGGVPAAALATQGFGADRPVATNDTALGRSQNRRVEVVRQ